MQTERLSLQASFLVNQKLLMVYGNEDVASQWCFPSFLFLVIWAYDIAHSMQIVARQERLSKTSGLF